MSRFYLIILILIAAGCSNVYIMKTPVRQPGAVTGNEFYHHAFPMKWAARDSFAVKELLAGNVPDFLKKMLPVQVSITDSAAGKTIKATL